MVRWFWLSCVVGGLLVLGGCGETKAPLAKVSGTVLVDGEPLDQGTIDLFGEAGATPQTFEVKNGKFQGEATLGKKKVAVHASREGKPTMMDKDEVPGSNKHERIADRFNKNTTLTAEVTASGMNPSEFKVEETKKK